MFLHFRSKFKEVLFLVASEVGQNGMNWCKANINETKIEFLEHENSSRKNAFFDFATMALSDHSIISHLDFGLLI